MTRREYAAGERARSEKTKRRAAAMTAAYVEYRRDCTPAALEALLIEVKRFGKAFVFSKAWSETEAEELESESILNLIKGLRAKEALPEERQIDPGSFHAYVATIYHNTWVEMIRKGRLAASGNMPRAGEQTGGAGDVRVWVDPMVNMDTPIGGEGDETTLGETIPDAAPGPEDSILLEEGRALALELLGEYLQVMFRYNGKPPALLALYYARVLPNHLVYLGEKAPMATITSAGWAYKRIAGFTVEELADGAEGHCLRFWPEKRMRWGDRFREKLEAGYPNAGGLPLKDMIYTEHFPLDKVEDWSRELHKTLVKRLIEVLLRDQELRRRASQYIAAGDRTLGMLVRGGDEDASSDK